jgi:D-glycero-D-manno-heptose 1,7-bisphosphate phosphatase
VKAIPTVRLAAWPGGSSQAAAATEDTSMHRRRAVFLDRDGVLNYNRRDYVKAPDEFVAIPGAAEAVAALKRAGWVVVVASNQSGLGRGLFDQATLDAIMAKMRAGLEAEGGGPDAVYYCPHPPSAGCDCRKPAPGMVLRAAREHRLDLACSFFVGDTRCDVECGRAAGLRTVLVETGLPEQRSDMAAVCPDYVARDLREAVAWIFRQESRPPQ